MRRVRDRLLGRFHVLGLPPPSPVDLVWLCRIFGRWPEPVSVETLDANIWAFEASKTIGVKE